jgi:hypothetical protein
VIGNDRGRRRCRIGTCLVRHFRRCKSLAELLKPY